MTNSIWIPDKSQDILNITVGGLLRLASTNDPNAICLIYGNENQSRRERWTFSETLEISEKVASALLERFNPGERIAVWAPNIPEWVFLEFGAALAGLVLVTVNPALRQNELEYVLKQSSVAGIFLTPGILGNAMSEIITKVRPNIDSLREVIYFSGWNDFLSSSKAKNNLPIVKPEDIAQIQYTSGTTGFPKGAMLHHRGITNNALFSSKRIGLVKGDIWVNPMPLFHTGGCVFSVLGSLGAMSTHVLVPSMDPVNIMDLIDKERGTVLGAVPIILTMMMKHPDFLKTNFSSLRLVISGGSSIDPKFVSEVESNLQASFIIAYGQTEAAPSITITSPYDDTLQRYETVGRPLPQTEVKIIDPETNRIVDLNKVGELCTRGYHVMNGYFDMKDATDEAIDKEGWLHTGDLCSMDEFGYCKVKGRLKEMIIVGGENVYPKEIEDAIEKHDGIEGASVVGVPDKKSGEKIIAFIKAVKDAEPDISEMKTFINERLAPVKTPKHWVIIDQFPLTPSGKIQKFELCKMFLKENEF